VRISKTGSVANENARHLDTDIPTERRFGWSDMFVAPDEDPRSQVPSVGERATLTDFLTGYRQTLEMKCQGLDAEQMARRSVPPSNMSLLGLIRHMADVERHWFRQVLSGDDMPRRFRTPEDHDADFNGATGDPAVVDEAWAAWHEEVAHAERCVEAFRDLGTTVPIRDEGVEIAVREVLVHMIEEYARHCGHADFLRERIDGRVGQ
jgi:uncharacterized damage-inducible protein DinB